LLYNVIEANRWFLAGFIVRSDDTAVWGALFVLNADICHGYRFIRRCSRLCGRIDVQEVTKRVINRHVRAQALLEFALVIVLLFVLIFGILEVGRILFIYAAVITSSREAVRYGSVAGRNENGNLYYQDCAGIRNTARRLAFFQNLQDNDILIEYDTGPETSVYDVCDGAVDTNVDPTPGDRIRVTITARFDLIVPIVPIDSRTIVSSSTRTILGIIKLE
jgi:hypothetical protein